VLRDFNSIHPVSEQVLVLAENLILATKMSWQPQTSLENIMRDADTAHFSDVNYILLSGLLREEWRLTLGKTFTDIEWPPPTATYSTNTAILPIWRKPNGSQAKT
jgi:hypothetical protein